MSEKDMEEKEGLYIPRRLMELDSHPIEGNFDLEHLFDILPMPKGRGFLDTNDTCLLK
ncbi:hypothetical protein [Megamonas funiformis]|uniref:hypothetical protein n=1 Tax=Megamonas funiformis TaxID=437897 RepID=UPI003A95A66B